VLDGGAAATLLVTVSTQRGPSLFAVERDAPGVTVEALPTGDRTRRVARVVLDGAAGIPLGRAGEAGAVLRRALDTTTVLLAAEQVGVAERCVDMAVDHARQREQFGRPIGAFQAVKHKLADVLLELEAARSVSMYAAWAADHRPEELPELACIAGATCGETALRAAGECIQVLGGMGITWEHDAHLFLKRALTSRVLLASPQEQLESLASRIGLDAPVATDVEETHGQPLRA
jgi:alkylation response protein AidB-like acyl-CoA dehydrogenase